MKNYQLLLKRVIGISALALLAATAPVDAQTDTSQSSSGAQQSESAQSQSGQSSDAADSSAQMQQSVAGSGREINEPAGADNEKNWSWLGLLGLGGLLGLKRRHDVHDENYRPLRT